MDTSETWHIPISTKDKYLDNALSEMAPFKLDQSDIPFIIRLVENPIYDVGLFAGNVTLFSHDCIHILLGRGLRLKDEAFVIGYTMGSTKKMRRWRRNLFLFISKFYPEGYKFTENERFVFNLGVLAGSKCESDLSKVDFSKYLKLKTEEARKKLSIDTELLYNCYSVEKKCFPRCEESQRLL